MKLTVWDIFKWLYKWKIGIFSIVVIALLLTANYIQTHQTYSAESFIRYTDANAKSGLTPSGTKMDVYEIISPSIISSVIADLNLHTNVESIRSAVTITPIIPDEVAEIQKSKQKNGETYDYYPTDYSIRFTVGSNKDGEYARDIIDAIVKNYSIFYSEQYLNSIAIPKVDFDIDTNKHDFLEVAEVMYSTTGDTIRSLGTYQKSNATFRSPQSGMSFNDLMRNYNEIKNYDLPGLFEVILNAQITQDKETLLKKYRFRKEQFSLQNKNLTEKSNVALSLMQQFAESNKAVPNAYNTQTNENYSDNFTSNNFYTGGSRTKATYDALVDNYVRDGVDAGNALIDIGYCDYIMNSFNQPPAALIPFDEAKAKAKDTIVYIKDKLSRLYDTTSQTIKDFNDLNASNNIVSLSGINISSSLQGKLYYLLAAAIGFLLGSVLAITYEILMNLKKESVE